ncbi:hypothetical protein [Salipiger bermudensis]|uniref:hypothetical protein n=1 Tax=Salipiger bermudensis TaxID=344736 RepID=UPI001A8C100C|nr:hypothetical protein [Salipiger bermudensis]MBN9675960.1 hypothetical protein [Salipiger bermudensis]
MGKFEDILGRAEKPALLIGNGINRFGGARDTSWGDLLDTLAKRFDLKLSKEEMKEMSNTEFFDLLDLARGNENSIRLQKMFCDLMEGWRPSEYHSRIANWARRNSTPLVTVNFDENFSKSIGGKKFKFGKNAMTDFYPWNMYYSDRRIDSVCQGFGIWHAHGMKIYPRSIRLGLTDYMGSVQRARSWVYSGEGSLRYLAKSGNREWRGQDTWLDIIFFKPLLVVGFSFGKDESFLRWLLLERARIFKINPSWKNMAWYVDVVGDGDPHRKPFFEGLGMKYVTLREHREIYDSPVWDA